MCSAQKLLWRHSKRNETSASITHHWCYQPCSDRSGRGTRRSTETLKTSGLWERWWADWTSERRSHFGVTGKELEGPETTRTEIFKTWTKLLISSLSLKTKIRPSASAGRCALKIKLQIFFLPVFLSVRSSKSGIIPSLTCEMEN